MLRFQASVGGHGKITWNTDKWAYRASGISTVQHILGQLWPYLGGEKREQARTAVVRWADVPRKRGFMFTPIGHRRGV